MQRTMRDILVAFTTACAFASVGLSASTESSLTRFPTDAALPRAGSYEPKNNFSECAKRVQAALSAAKKSSWGDFDYTCTDGKVTRVYVSTASPIESTPGTFASMNPGLFDIAGSSLVVEEARGGRQKFGATEIANTGVVDN